MEKWFWQWIMICSILGYMHCTNVCIKWLKFCRYGIKRQSTSSEPTGFLSVTLFSWKKCNGLKSDDGHSINQSQIFPLPLIGKTLCVFLLLPSSQTHQMVVILCSGGKKNVICSSHLNTCNVPAYSPTQTLHSYFY